MEEKQQFSPKSFGEKFYPCSTKESFLKNIQNLQECSCTGVRFQPSTCNFIEKRRRHVYFSLKICEIF